MWKEKGDTIQWKSNIRSKFFCIKFCIKKVFKIQEQNTGKYPVSVLHRETHSWSGGENNRNINHENTCLSVIIATNKCMDFYWNLPFK